jgi:hypothetical protein
MRTLQSTIGLALRPYAGRRGRLRTLADAARDLGDLTLAGWLAHLEQHATREIPLRVRG